ncbi:MAG: hypothetical protein ACK5P3_08925, partial [Dolichospermum sp.]
YQYSVFKFVFQFLGGFPTYNFNLSVENRSSLYPFLKDIAPILEKQVISDAADIKISAYGNFTLSWLALTQNW